MSSLLAVKTNQSRQRTSWVAVHNGLTGHSIAVSAIDRVYIRGNSLVVVTVIVDRVAALRLARGRRRGGHGSGQAMQSCVTGRERDVTMRVCARHN